MKHYPFYLMSVIEGQQSMDLFGSQIEIGDIDQDGVDEIIISAPSSIVIQDPDSVNPQHKYNCGRVYVFKGEDKRLLHQWAGSDHHLHFGYALTLGDVNGDGYSEVIITAPFEGSENGVQCGAVHIYSGQTGKPLSTIYGDKSFKRLGFKIVAADINQDGYDDLIISSLLIDEQGEKGTGQVEVYSGKDGQLIYAFTAEGKEQFGYALATCDVDQDGYPDIIVGAPEASTPQKGQCGKVYIFSGKNGQQITQFEGEKSGDRLGTAVAAGDINGDQQPELVVGSCFSSNDGYLFNGSLFVYSLINKTLNYRINGEHHYTKLGSKVVLHDLDGDGQQEIIVATKGSYSMVIDGGTGKEIKRLHGDPSANFGANLAAGDINGDGHAELLISALTSIQDNAISGTVYIFSANPHFEQKGQLQLPEQKQQQPVQQPSASYPTTAIGTGPFTGPGTAPGTGPGTAPGTGPGTTLLNQTDQKHKE